MKKWLRVVCVGCIRFYQLTISPYIGPCCRFSPSCSEYAIDAFNRYGVIKGGYLTARRLMRCHPWGGSGMDPVPEVEKGRENA